MRGRGRGGGRERERGREGEGGREREGGRASIKTMRCILLLQLEISLIVPTLQKLFWSVTSSSPLPTASL